MELVLERLAGPRAVQPMASAILLCDVLLRLRVVSKWGVREKRRFAGQSGLSV